MGIFALLALILRVVTGFYQSDVAMLMVLATMMIGAKAGLLSLTTLLLGMLVMPEGGATQEIVAEPMSAVYLTLLRGFDLGLTVTLVGWTAWRCASGNSPVPEHIYQHATHDDLTGMGNQRALI